LATADHRGGRLMSRPALREPAGPLGAGLHRLGLAADRDAHLFEPPGLPPDPVPLAVLLHGAGGSARNILPLLTGPAEARGFLVLAPESQDRTWDVIAGGYGPDIERLDRALRIAFEHYRVDPARIAIAGFSDGASYALSLGVANGDLFGDVLAFSPGFLSPLSVAGRPRVFISHGVRDPVLPIERCGRRVAAELRKAGYDLDYREFEDGHVVPPDMAAAALDRFLGPGS
jgi:phospholipase/carboxylesterase